MGGAVREGGDEGDGGTRGQGDGGRWAEDGDVARRGRRSEVILLVLYLTYCFAEVGGDFAVGAGEGEGVEVVRGGPAGEG